MQYQLPTISYETLIQLFLEAPVAICVIKGEDLILTASNEQMLTFLGLNKEHIGRPLTEVQPKIAGSVYETQLKEVLRDGVCHQGFGHEFSLVSNGKVQEEYYDYNCTPLKDHNGEISGIIVTGANVTAHVLANKRIAASEKKFRDLIMLSEVPTVVYTGEDLIIEMVNQSAKDLWSRPYEVEGMKLEDALPELRTQANSQMLREVMKTGRQLRKDGARVVFDIEGKESEKFFNIFYKPIVSENGKINSILSMGVDVTAQTLENQLISRNEERLKQFIAAMPMAISILRGPEFIMDLSNRNTWELWPSKNKRVGNTLTELYPEVERTQFLEVLKKAYDTGEAQKLSEYRLNPEGAESPVYVSYRFTPVDFPGEERMVISVGNEVTEEVLLREQLYDSDQNFRMLTNSIPQILWTAEGDGTVTYFNAKWYEFTGSQPEDERAKNWWDLVHPDDRDEVAKVWRIALEQGTDYEIECRMKNAGKEGAYTWFLARAIPMKDAAGNVVKWFGSNTDIQDYKIFQKHKDDFIGLTSHELKTPLTSIKLYAQAMERMLQDDANERILSFAQSMGEQVNRLNALITDLVDVTRIQNGQLTLNESVFDFDELAEEVVKMMQMSADHHKLQLKTGETGMIKADRNRISQVMINFISNAVKYSPQSEKVEIETSVTPKGMVRFRVKDSGIGIKQEHLHKIFDQFYRASEEDLHSFEGMGLGLHISNEIIKRSGGKKTVESTEGKGSIFCFELPRNL